VHLAAGFDRAEAIIVLKAVIDWGANGTAHGAALFQALYTLQPEHPTLHSTPYNLHPTPYTLLTTPCTLNPVL